MDICKDLNPRREWEVGTHEGDGNGDEGQNSK